MSSCIKFYPAWWILNKFSYFSLHMEIKETRTSTISYDPKEGFLRMVSKPVSEVTLADIAQIRRLAGKLVNFKRAAVLADPRHFTSFSKEIRDFYARKEASRIISAMAILVTDLPTRLIGNFFIKIHQPHYPAKIFTSETEAAKWLASYRNKE